MGSEAVDIPSALVSVAVPVLAPLVAIYDTVMNPAEGWNNPSMRRDDWGGENEVPWTELPSQDLRDYHREQQQRRSIMNSTNQPDFPDTWAASQLADQMGLVELTDTGKSYAEPIEPGRLYEIFAGTPLDSSDFADGMSASDALKSALAKLKKEKSEVPTKGIERNLKRRSIGEILRLQAALEREAVKLVRGTMGNKLLAQYAHHAPNPLVGVIRFLRENGVGKKDAAEAALRHVPASERKDAARKIVIRNLGPRPGKKGADQATEQAPPLRVSDDNALRVSALAAAAVAALYLLFS
jgi:hypothetical protein